MGCPIFEIFEQDQAYGEFKNTPAEELRDDSTLFLKAACVLPSFRDGFLTSNEPHFNVTAALFLSYQLLPSQHSRSHAGDCLRAPSTMRTFARMLL